MTSRERPAKRQKKFHKQSKRERGIVEGSTEDVLLADVREILASVKLGNSVALNEPCDQDAEDTGSVSKPTLPERFVEIEVKIDTLSSTGDGVGTSTLYPDHVFVVPFSLPGDTVLAKLITHFPEQKYSLSDFVSVISPSSQRDDALVKCPYFATCSGCQLQMLSYPRQLLHKRSIIQRAYRNFSNLAPELVPEVEDTIPSPMEYGYRTKLTPHFDGPKNGPTKSQKRNGARASFESVPEIGFMKKGTRKTLDIEDCPIGTEAVRGGLRSERSRVTREIGKYSRGATLLLREDTKRVGEKFAKLEKIEEIKAIEEAVEAGNVVKNSDPNNTVPEETASANGERGANSEAHADHGFTKIGDGAETTKALPNDAEDAEAAPAFTDVKICVTDSNATTTEYIDDFIFTNPAGAFFQNNNSILPRFTSYVRSLIAPYTESQATHPPIPDSPARLPITHLLDAYSGSGLFTITLSPLNLISTGIDISPQSIASATQNARLNKLPADKFAFQAADASAIFKELDAPPDQTVVVIDPPRKGCDRLFLEQLLAFGPRLLVYVSCNVHTQARDVGQLVEGAEGRRYELKSLRGLDFFPQTGHVEGVAVLERV